MSGRKVGVWLIGAYGSISVTVIVGAFCLREGLIRGTGMITETDLFNGIDLIGLDSIEFGGCDIRSGNIREVCRHLSNETGVVTERILEAVGNHLAEVEHCITLGTARNCGDAIQTLAVRPVLQDGSARAEIEAVRKHLRQFKERRGVDTVVVVNLASTEPPLEMRDCHQELALFESALDRNEAQIVRASTVYSYAAIQEGCPYINFTPSSGALFPAIVQLAQRNNVPVMGNDGKTGETLVKSALAPMFLCRNLEVLSWEGFNILGNMDGRILDHPKNKESKIKTKDRVLSKILGYTPHSRVHIDYVPSLDDQKTAWDFIHFRGFLGAKMSLQFIWQGYDSLLAAPLVLDLIRLAELAKVRGEAGLMPHLASYFKAPLGVDDHRLYEQFYKLVDYVEGIREQHSARGA